MNTNTDLMKSLSRSPSYRQCIIVAHVPARRLFGGAVLRERCEKQKASRKGRKAYATDAKKTIRSARSDS